MSDTIQVPDNIPVSWLERLRALGPDVLMLASEPNADTETQFMSKYFTFGQMEGQVSVDLSIGTIWDRLSDLYDGKASLSDYMTGTVKLNFLDPYIISSMTHIVSSDHRFGMVSVDGYRLSTGMQTVFNNFYKANRELTGLMPQLNTKTTAVSDPVHNYITSITDKNGHVQSFGYMPFKDVIDGNIGSATKTVTSPDNAITSVTTNHGVVTAVGEKSVKQIIGNVSKVMYEDFSDQAHAKRLPDTQIDLYMMKLTHAQLAELSAAGNIVKDCLYLTVNDPTE